MTQSFNLIEFHFPPPGKRENNDHSIDSTALNGMSSSSQKMAAAIFITQVWKPDCEVQLLR